ENTLHFTTYGRDPAIEVILPEEYAGTDATGVLGTLGEYSSQIPATRDGVEGGRACLSLLLNSTRASSSNEGVRSYPRGTERSRDRAMTPPCSTFPPGKR